MGENSKIEWTETTWNPVRGCVKVSPGCKHCYAETFAERFRGVVGHPYEQGFEVRVVPDKLAEPFLWRSPRTVFVNSMSDLFQDDIPSEFLHTVVEVMHSANWHTYQVLTKRADRMGSLLSGTLKFAAGDQHIWWGVSVEDRRYGLPRVQRLRESPGKIRFLSIEPLLEDLGIIDLRGIDWVIVGGESGSGARFLDEAWVYSLRDQCLVAKVPFFFKQWGGVNKKRNGRELGGRTYDEIPPRISAPFPDKHIRLTMAERFSIFAREWESKGTNG